jgi:hypothetical protein
MTDRDRLEELLDRVEVESVAWKPEPEEKVAGVVVDVITRDGKFGEYPIVEIDTGNRVVAFHAFHAAARREIEGRNIRRGDVIAIKYLGEIDDGNRSYHGYKIVVDRDSAPATVETVSDEPSDFAQSG